MSFLLGVISDDNLNYQNPCENSDHLAFCICVGLASHPKMGEGVGRCLYTQSCFTFYKNWNIVLTPASDYRFSSTISGH